MAPTKAKWWETLFSGFMGAVIGGAIAIVGQCTLQDTNDSRNAEILQNSLCTEVSAENKKQQNILEKLKTDLAALSLPGDPLQRTDAPRRRWLISPISTSFPVFDLNVSRLGELPTEARDLVYEYFGLAKQFRIQINFLSGTAITQASYPERVDAVDQLHQMFSQLQSMAPIVTTSLKCDNHASTSAK